MLCETCGSPHQLLKIDFAVVVAAIKVMTDGVRSTGPKDKTEKAYKRDGNAHTATDPFSSHRCTRISDYRPPRRNRQPLLHVDLPMFLPGVYILSLRL